MQRKVDDESIELADLNRRRHDCRGLLIGDPARYHAEYQAILDKYRPPRTVYAYDAARRMFVPQEA